MSEVFFGGNGARERREYDELRGGELQQMALEGVTQIESLFEQSYAIETAAHSFSTDKDGMIREISLSYPVFDKSSDDVLYYDPKNGVTYVAQGRLTSYEKDVAMRHITHRKGPILEEYFVSFERRVPHINGTFFHTYMFDFMVDGAVQITVTSTNIDVDDEYDGNVFERQASTYDMEELNKEIGEVMKHLEAGHQEKLVLERLQL